MKKNLFLIFIQLIIFKFTFSQEIKYDNVSVELSKLKNDRENYFASREILYNADSLLTVGYDIPLSENELKVSDYLSSLQKSFIQSTGKDFPPSNFFYEGRQMIDTNMVFKIFRKMPKGGLLHLHPSAGGNAEWVISNITYMDNCYMYTSHDGKIRYGAMMFFHPDSVKAGWESFKILREVERIIDEELMQLLTFDQSDKGNKRIWLDFESVFRRMGLTAYEPAFRMFTRALFDSLLADGSQHIELRTSLGGVYDLNGNILTHEECLLIYKEIIKDVKELHPEFTAKLIFSDFRGAPKETVMKDLLTAYDLRKKYPELLIGFDQVAEEDRWNKTSYYLEQFFAIDSIAKKEGYDLPYYFHDGESTLPSNDNLIDAVMLNTRRIGHGINLFRFPMLELAVKEKKIAVEVCPISNQILGYVQDLRMHPASGYIKRNIPITINTDDPQIFNYNGLTYDFWTAFMAWELDLRTIKKLALNSLVYSGLNKDEKKEALKYFNMKWD
ncbi:MAG: hypothetical protein ABIY50_10630, partial [Ignavibacteria bacterium]